MPAVVPPAPTLTVGTPLLLRDSEGVTLTETSGTTPATVTLYLRSRGETNGQPVTIGAGDSLPVDGREVSSLALTGGAVSYALGTRHSPTVTPTPPTGVTHGVVVFGSNGGVPIVENLAPNGDSFTRIHESDGAASLYTPYDGSGNAPATGVWTVAIKATVATFPTINGNLLAGPNGETAAVVGTVYLYRYPVTRGSAYAVADGSVVDGVVS